MSLADAPAGRAGITRGASSPLYHLITPENRMPTRLPWFDAPVRSTMLVSAGGRSGTFSEAIVATEAPARSASVPAGYEHVLYVLGGTALVLVEAGGGAGFDLEGAGAYAYLDPGTAFTLALGEETSFVWIRRPWVAPEGAGAAGPGAPAPFAGARDDAVAVPLGPPGVEVRALLPDDVAFDLAVNVMSFAPEAALDMVEIHDEDHGLYLLSGHGSYLLDRERHEVEAGDFIYMAPYCPQHFAAGPEPAEYLLYKPANRFR